MSGKAKSNNIERSGIGLKRLVVFAGLFLMLSALGVYVVYGAVAQHAFTFDKRLLDWNVLVTIAALLALYYVSDALRLHFTLRSLGQRVPLPLMLRLVFVNIFFSNVTPLASGGGFAQIWFLQRKGVPLGTATTAATVRTLLAMSIIFTAAPLLFLALVPSGTVNFDAVTLAYLGLFIGAYVAFFAILLFRRRWLVAVLGLFVGLLWQWRFIGEHRHRRWQFGSKRELVRFARGFGKYVRGPRSDVALSVLFTLVFLISLFSFPALLIWGLGYDVAWFRSAGLAAVTTFVMYFSPTPGASGIAEGVFGHLFRGLIRPEHLVLVTLGWRFLTIHIGMLAGVFAIHHELTRGGDTTCADANVSKPSST